MLMKLSWAAEILSLEEFQRAALMEPSGSGSFANLWHPSSNCHGEPVSWLWQITLLAEPRFLHATAFGFQGFWFCFAFKDNPAAQLLKSLLFTGMCVPCQLCL